MISVVVTSYDVARLRDISELLDSLSQQTEQGLELVYVTERDERLFDNVKRMLETRSLEARVVRNRGEQGLSQARNLGISVSTGGIVAFLDDDVVANKNWARAIRIGFENLPEAIGVTGPALPCWVGEPLDWFPPELDWLIGCTRWFHADRPIEVRNCWGMNMAFKREAFEEAGMLSRLTGYHRGEMAEDVEFSIRARNRTRKRAYYLPDMVVLSKVYPYRLSSRFIVARASWIGYSRRNISRVFGGQNTQMEGELMLATAKSLVRLPASQRNPNLFKRARVVWLALLALGLGYAVGPFA